MTAYQRFEYQRHHQIFRQVSLKCALLKYEYKLLYKHFLRMFDAFCKVSKHPIMFVEKDY